MTYYGGKELAASFRTVRGNTIQVAQDIPEDKYGFRAAPESRTIGETLVHIALSSGFQHHIQSNKIGDLQLVNFPELMQKATAQENVQRSKADIVTLLTTEGEKFASFLEGLPESFLGERVTMMPGSEPATKSRFEMLLSPKEHEMHHRAQLMVLQRMCGLTPHLTRQRREQMAQRAAAAQAGR